MKNQLNIQNMSNSWKKLFTIFEYNEIENRYRKLGGDGV